MFEDDHRENPLATIRDFLPVRKCQNHFWPEYCPLVSLGNTRQHGLFAAILADPDLGVGLDVFQPERVFRAAAIGGDQQYEAVLFDIKQRLGAVSSGFVACCGQQQDGAAEEAVAQPPSAGAQQQDIQAGNELFQ